MLQRLKAMPLPQLAKLAAQIREQIISIVNRSGGHLSSNLGVVELTLAWHRVFSAPEDQLIFDVGHQCYTHKILTRGFDAFQSFRQPHGLAGFPNRFESADFDPFGAGHASTSLSAVAGLSRAKRLLNKKGLVTALIGDASFVGGLSLEALNDIGFHQDPLLIILNDNGFSIDPTVGGLSQTHRYHQLAESFGIQVHPEIIDGHDLSALLKAFRQARRSLLKPSARPLLIHVRTIKGFGLERSRHDPVNHHGIKANFLSHNSPTISSPTDDLVARELLSLMTKDKSVVVLTPAMGSRSGLSVIQSTFPDRFFDVGIAEEHAAVTAAGMAANGLKPFLMIYSTFLQRAYDQLLHDIDIQRLPVRLLINRIGAHDHITHFGIYDISFLQPLPHFALRAPTSDADLIKQIHWLHSQDNCPSSIRFPGSRGFFLTPTAGTDQTAFLILGGLDTPSLIDQYQALLNTHPEASVFLLNQIKPLPRDFLLKKILPHFSQIFTFEDGVITGGWGEQISLLAQQQNWGGEIRNVGNGIENLI
ncbi:1-deoxy-D-xylulose-5-phosphate synthase [Microgenomates group bacterium]|nr:1-deoxy-D-xylulose-5-phosphate synthase [Microgenomates group bacterium]